MASNKKRNGQQVQGNNTTVPHTVPQSNSKAPLEKQIPMWKASFENASKVYKETGQNLDVPFDEANLNKVIQNIYGEDISFVSNWIGKFANLCRDLAKYQQNLNEEYKARWDTCNQKGQELEVRESELDAIQTKLDQQSEILEKRQSESEQLQQQLTKQQGEITEREREITMRELNAESGFEKQNREALEKLKKDHTKETSNLKQAIVDLQSQKSELEQAIEHAKVTFTETEQKRKLSMQEEDSRLSKLMFDIEQEKIAFKKEQEHFVRIREAFEAEKASYQTDLDLKNAFASQQLENDRKEIESTLSIERQRLDQDWEDLSEARKNLDALVSDAMQHERQAHLHAEELKSKKLDRAWQKVEELNAKLSDYIELESILGEQSIEELLKNMNVIKEENRSLRRTLTDSDTATLADDNEHLRNRLSDLENELRELRPQLQQAQTEAGHKRVAATELQNIKRESRVLAQHKNALQVHIDDLDSRIEKLTDAHKTQTPFPAMSGMDKGKDFQATMEMEEIPDLQKFAEELQHRIAQAEDSVKLYYPLEDIQVLLGGLAMSQLHVFQGISGTGKTSLAKAFAKAMGGFCTDIAVQAGWRDRDDLLGHYNAFERRFYEKDCLQALYKAQTPRWQDSCNVILLDEMNLSRPEQYFAEFLSALEKNNLDERLISLSETALPQAPNKLIEGRQIRVPRNVWFIGTANHDETTNELADKTYDRAHVMTLPKQDHQFKINDYKPTNYSFKSLNKAFDSACKKHTLDVKKLLSELTGNDFTKQLEDNFGLGWGNRFEKQALRFVPVMQASGSNRGKAFDHLLATRVMRQGKVTGRFDVSADSVRSLMNSLEIFWKQSELDGSPEASLALLEKDVKSKEAGF